MSRKTIRHIAEKTRWYAARDAGAYVESTLGRTLADEGFIHCSEEWQWRATLERFYAAYDGDLVLLTIDEDALTAPLIREVGNPVTGEVFPHLYGPLDPAAIVAVDELGDLRARRGG